MENAATSGNSTIGLIIWCLVIFGFMYFMMIRPNQKKMAEYKKLLASLKVGNKIITAAGIYGTIKSISETTIKVEIAAGVIIEVAKSSIANMA